MVARALFDEIPNKDFQILIACTVSRGDVLYSLYRSREPAKEPSPNQPASQEAVMECHGSTVITGSPRDAFRRRPLTWHNRKRLRRGQEPSEGVERGSGVTRGRSLHEQIVDEQASSVGESIDAGLLLCRKKKVNNLYGVECARCGGLHLRRSHAPSSPVQCNMHGVSCILHTNTSA